MAYFIKRIVPIETHEPVTRNVPVEIDGETLFRQETAMEPKTVDTVEDVEIFEELPAPAVTLGGRLLALENETGYRHIAVDGAVAPKSTKKV
jgi:hypothetical protein